MLIYHILFFVVDGKTSWLLYLGNMNQCFGNEGSNSSLEQDKKKKKWSSKKETLALEDKV